MASSTDWTLKCLDNPLLIQAAILDRFEKATDHVIVDPNNPTSVCMEMFSTLAARAVTHVDDTVRPAIYPARASNTSDLYKHVSDYDYVDIFAAPAETTLLIIADKDYAVNNALPVPIYDEDGETIIGYEAYKKITIPSTTTFTVGDYSFGIYYPIDLRVNTKTGNFTVVYDTSKTNPLHAVQNNTLEYDFRFWENLNLVYIKVPVYQFKITSHETPLIASSGYRQAIPYENKFYALRCRAEVLQNYGHDASEEDKWELQELKLAMAGQTYDPTVPTVVFSPDLENNELVLEIPFIYFSNEQIRSNLIVDIYTTEGKLDYSIPTGVDEVTSIDMFSNITNTVDAEFAHPFQTMPALNCIPLSMSVIGGDDGLTFGELRKRVVNGTLKSNTLQTPADIEAYFDKNNYITTLLKDGITDRIFICHATLRNSAGEVVGADTIGTIFDFNDANSYQTIILSGHETYTVLPTTLYKYDQNAGVCYPLTDAEMMQLQSLSPAEKVAEFNNNVYCISPYYLQICKKDRYPTSVTYDLEDHEITMREFLGERTDVGYQLLLNTVNFELMKQADKRFDQYRITFRVGRTGLPDLQAQITEGETAGQKNIRVLVALKNDDGNFYFEEARWLYRTEDDYDVFEVLVPFKAVFHQANNDHTLVLQFGKDSAGVQQSSDFFMTSEARVILLLNNEVEDLKSQMSADIWLDTDFTNTSFENITNCVAMSEHRVIFRFGNVVNELDQRVNLTYSEAEYKRHCDTKLITLKEDVYAKDEYGNVDYKWIKYNYTGVAVNTAYDETKTYYVRSGTSYVKSDVADSDLEDGKFKTGGKYFLRSTVDWVQGTDTEGAKDGIELMREYLAGTLFCLSKRIPEQVVLNKYLANNYIGCKWIDPADTTVHEFTGSTDPEGRYEFKDSHVVPRFSVVNGTSADLTFSEYTAAPFELRNPYSAKSFSSSTNRWVSQTCGDATILELQSMNALEYIVKEVIGFTGGIHALGTNPACIDGGGSETPLEGYEASVGTFVLVYRDASPDTTDYVVPQVTPIAVTAATRVKLYMMTTAGWACLCQAATADDLIAQINRDESEALATEVDEVNDYPQVHGYVYKFVQKNGTNDAGDTVPTKRLVSWLTTKKISLNGSTVEIPDLQRLSKWQYIKVEESKPDSNTMYYTIDWANTHPQPQVLPTNANPSDLGLLEKNESDNTYFTTHDQQVDETKTYYYVQKYAYTSHPGITHFNNNVTYFTLEKDAAWIQSDGCKWPFDLENWQEAFQSSLIKDGEAVSTSEIVDGAPVYTPVSITGFARNTAISTVLNSTLMYKYWEYSAKQYILDDLGNLIPDETKPRHIQYMADMLQLDAKLAQTSANVNDGTYPTSLVGVMRTHFANLGQARNHLFTNTRLFFSPVKSIGHSEFSVGDGNTITLPLDVSMKFKLHVSQATADDETLVDDIRSNVITIIDDYISVHGIINCVEIAREIMNRLAETVKWVDVGGIDGNPELQTMKSINKEAVPHLKHRLTLLDDGVTIDIDRGLDLEIVVQND